MTPEQAVAIACDRCVTAASLLAAAQLPLDADDRAVGRVFAAGVVCGWADETSVGSADATGINVRERREATAIRVRWSQIAEVVLPGLRAPGVAERLAEVYARYVGAATSTRVADRLAARVASAELAQVRRMVLDVAAERLPVQQSLFPDPPTRGRSLAR